MERSSSAHLFLPYASDHSRRSFDHSSNQDSSSQELIEAVRRYFDWGQSEKQFEAKCSEHLRQEHNVPQFHATFVSKAVQKGAEEAAKRRSRDVHKSYCLYASMFEQLLSPKSRPKSLEGRDDSKGQVTSSTDVDSLYSKVQSLKQEAQSQQEELEFLRCALRTLILPSRRSGESQGSHRDNPPKHSKQGQVDTGSPDRTHDIPNEIVIRLNSSNDVLDEISRFSNPHEEKQEETEQDVEEFVSVEDYGPANPELEETIDSQHQPPSTTLPQHDEAQKSLQSNDDGGPGRPLTCVEETMDLVYSLRAKDDFATPYSEMTKGEVHDDRARGIEHELSFKELGRTLRGVYNGQVNPSEVPHGRGVLRFDNRDLYIGEFRDGKMHGEGTMFCRSKSKLVTLRGVFRLNEYVGRHPVSKKENLHSAGGAGS